MLSTMSSVTNDITMPTRPAFTSRHILAIKLIIGVTARMSATKLNATPLTSRSFFSSRAQNAKYTQHGHYHVRASTRARSPSTGPTPFGPIRFGSTRVGPTPSTTRSEIRSPMARPQARRPTCVQRGWVLISHGYPRQPNTCEKERMQ